MYPYIQAIVLLCVALCANIRAEDADPSSPINVERIVQYAIEKIGPDAAEDEIPRLKKKLENDPSNCNDWAHLSWAYLADRQFGEADKAIQASLRIRPYHARHMLVQLYCDMAFRCPDRLPMLLAKLQQCSVVPFNDVAPPDIATALQMIEDPQLRASIADQVQKLLKTNMYALDRSRASILAEAEKSGPVLKTAREPLNKYRFWIAIEGKFLRVYDEERDTFEDLAPEAPAEFANSTVTQMLFIHQRLLALANGTLLSFDLQNEKWLVIAPPEGLAPGEKIIGLNENDAETVQIRYENASFRFDPAAAAFTKLSVQTAAGDVLKDNPDVQSFAHNRYGDLEKLSAAQAEAALAQYQELEKYLKDNMPSMSPAVALLENGKLDLVALDKIATAHGAPAGGMVDEMRAMTLPAWRSKDFAQPSARQAIADIAAMGANWISIVSTAYQNDPFSTDVAADPEKTPTLDSVQTMIQAAHKAGLKVLLKTHVNLQIEEKDNHIWRGMIALRSNEEVAKWFANYEKFMMEHVDVAIKENVEMMTVGVELRKLTTHVPAWKALIEAIRKRGYTGKLTFAALHEDFQKIAFWDALDYVGIDAYFELTKNATPPLTEIIEAVKRLSARLDEFSRNVKKPVIFTEVGFNNLVGTASKPWFWSGNSANLDNLQQAACYHAMLAVMTRQKWLAGLFWWTWYPGDPPRPKEASYSPQAKLAAMILEAYYGADRTPVVQVVPVLDGK